MMYHIAVPASAPEATKVKVEKELVGMFGGFTRFEAHGGWKAGNGETVTVGIHWYSAAEEGMRKGRVEAMGRLAEAVRVEAQQEAAMWGYGGFFPFFVTAPVPEPTSAPSSVPSSEPAASEAAGEAA